jgi:hypothetical protein
MVDFTIDFNEQDLADYDRLLERYQKELGLSPKKAGKIAMVNVLTSLKASTRKSKKHRKVKADSRLRRNEAGYPGRRRFRVEAYRKGVRADFYLYARSLGEAKSSRATKIRYHKLAYASWGWLQRDVFRSGAVAVGFGRPQGVVGSTVAEARGFYSVSLVNRVEYMQRAFSSGGSGAVALALYRANRSMQKKLDEDLSKIQ